MSPQKEPHLRTVFEFEYLGEYGAMSKTALENGSGTRWRLLKKNPKSENFRATLSFVWHL
jgi:hypothetical protein